MFSKLNDTTFCVEILHYKVSIMEAERCTNDRLLTFIISEPNWSPFHLASVTEVETRSGRLCQTSLVSYLTSAVQALEVGLVTFCWH